MYYNFMKPLQLWHSRCVTGFDPMTSTSRILVFLELVSNKRRNDEGLIGFNEYLTLWFRYLTAIVWFGLSGIELIVLMSPNKLTMRSFERISPEHWASCHVSVTSRPLCLIRLQIDYVISITVHETTPSHLCFSDSSTEPWILNCYSLLSICFPYG